MWRISALAIALSAVAIPAVAQQAGECREFTAPVMVAGAQKQATGRACLQPDGNWRIAQEDPLPAQLYLAPPIYVPPPPAYTPIIPTNSWGHSGYFGGGTSYGSGFGIHHRSMGWGWNGWGWSGWGWGGRRW